MITDRRDSDYGGREPIGAVTFCADEASRDTPKDLKHIKPKFLNDLVRLGRNHDGGYVINERSVRSCRCLISLGVSTDWSFEADFLNHKPDAKVLCFDHSVSKDIFRRRMLNALNQLFSLRSLLFLLSGNFSGLRRILSLCYIGARLFHDFSAFVARDNVEFYQLGISNERTPPFVTFAEVFELISRKEDVVPENSVFVKMDIEGSEFRVLNDLLKFKKYISSLVIEFHGLDILWPQFVGFTRQLAMDFHVTHVHGNNHDSFIPNCEIPRVLEITFLKKELVGEESSAREHVCYPIEYLDYPNNSAKKDYTLSQLW